MLMSSTAIVPSAQVEDDKDGEPDRRFRRRHRQHQQCEDLPGQVMQEGREGDEVEVHGEQDQLDRHQDDDDVLAVQEDAEHAEREEDRRNGKIVAEPDGHESPCPDCTLVSTSTAVAGFRATCTATFWRFTPTLWRRVSTIAPIMATSSTSPANWK